MPFLICLAIEAFRLLAILAFATLVVDTAATRVNNDLEIVLGLLRDAT